MEDSYEVKNGKNAATKILQKHLSSLLGLGVNNKNFFEDFSHTSLTKKISQDRKNFE